MSTTVINTTTTKEDKNFFFYEDEEIPIHPTGIIFQKLNDSSFKGAVVYNEVLLDALNYKKPPEQRQTFNKLERKFVSYNLAVDLPHQKSILLSTYKTKIAQLIQGGFFSQWMKPYSNDASLIAREEEDNRVVLTMEHLSVGFTIWLGMLLIAAVAFLAELARFYLPKYFRAIFFKTFLTIYLGR